MILNLSTLSLLGACISSVIAATNCPLHGPDFPAPTALSTNPIFKSALSNLTHLLTTTTSTGHTPYGPLDTANTSFSIEIFSIHEPSPLLYHQHSAPILSSLPHGVHTITRNTTFRIGSTTKLLTIYTYLIAAGDTSWNTPITHCIPELLAASQPPSLNASQNPIDHVSWSDITIWELASHMSGIGREYSSLNELSNPALGPLTNPTNYGLPPLDNPEQYSCLEGVFCNRTAFFAGFVNRHPVYAPSTSPIYSNAAFTILSFALENITGLPLETLVQNSLFTPLNLTGSSWYTPSSNATSVLTPSGTWGLDAGTYTPEGGAYSSSADLTSIGRSILSSTLISPAMTRRWMQPRGLLSAPNAAVGAPWEIYRITTSPGNRLVDLYTKSGDVPGYASMFVLFKDYGIGFSVLAAGDGLVGGATPASRVLAAMVVDTLTQAIEDTARNEAGINYAGTYTSQIKGLNSSITLVADDGRPGLGVTRWISNGTDMLSPRVASIGISGSSVRLYPTGLERDLENEKGEREVGFRAIFEDLEGEGIGGLFGTQCDTWFGVDGTYWGGVGVDEFLVTVGRDGRAWGWEARAERASMNRE